MKTCAYWKPCISHEGPAGRWETQLWPLNVSCWPSVNPCLICGKSYIYWVLRKKSSAHSVAVIRSCDTLVLTSLSLSSSTTSCLFFILPWQRVSWPFFRLWLCLFLTRSLGFLELFSNFPLSVFGYLSIGPAPSLAISRTIWSEWTRAWWPSLS